MQTCRMEGVLYFAFLIFVISEDIENISLQDSVKQAVLCFSLEDQ